MKVEMISTVRMGSKENIYLGHTVETTDIVYSMVLSQSVAFSRGQ